MTTDRTMSMKTWEKLDRILWKIHRKAWTKNDMDLIKESDKAIFLLRSFSAQILIEDKRAVLGPTQNLDYGFIVPAQKLSCECSKSSSRL
jgi:hypothetical protein